MKLKPTVSHTWNNKGLTLLEITMVISIMLLLASIVTYSLTAITDWRQGRAASENLRSVYVAQKSYLADHPTHSTSSLTEALIIPYLPGSPGAMPTFSALDGSALTVEITSMPPVLQLSGSDYDPSDTTEDGLWDVGGL